MKGQTEVGGAPSLSGDLVICSEEARSRILPAGDKAPDHVIEPRMPWIARRAVAQDQPNQVGRRKVKLLAAVDAVLGEARDDEAVQVILQTTRLVDAVEKAR